MGSITKPNKRQRAAFLLAAREAAARGDHDGARVLFAYCDVSYSPVIREIQVYEQAN